MIVHRLSDRAPSWGAMARAVVCAAALLVAIGAPALSFQDPALSFQDDDKKDAKPGPNVVAGARPLVRPPVNPKARLSCEPGADLHEFGLVRQGAELTHTFELKSAGTEPLIISHASPSCGCLVGEIKTRPIGAKSFESYTLGEPIAPGTDITLETVVQTAAKVDRTEIAISVYTNQAAAAKTLTLRVDVEPRLRATPPFLLMGDIPMGEGRTGRIDVHTSRGESVKLTVDDSRGISMPEGFTYELVPVSPKADGRSNHWRVTFRVAPETKEGPGGFGVILVSDIELPETSELKKRRERMAALGRPIGPRGRFYHIAANANYRVLGELSISPPAVPLGLVAPGTPAVGRAQLIAADPDFDLSNATVEMRGALGLELPWAEHFTTSIKPVEGTNAIEITVTLAGLPKGAAGAFRGMLVVQTGHPEKPELSVPVTGVVR